MREGIKLKARWHFNFSIIRAWTFTIIKKTHPLISTQIKLKINKIGILFHNLSDSLAYFLPKMRDRIKKRVQSLKIVWEESKIAENGQKWTSTVAENGQKWTFDHLGFFSEEICQNYNDT